ncbi:hypothetical protein MBM_07096 [Drepanopeziza brunnea f. sp. 'multigermtubi' MB_m1]|uniref:Uncharacterized protein n=1 Tax=Marssonina brunnea f. sp. multigermtubi (strain MB_m1) TaxID=1072389 RepID=K1WBY0_MARBU|nr:uncharacterized protein MBM_07096 [Drepanopeziza brunnea f. sp. 'multigermtubi' MB_m1]EKD14885.1 hypothetical protein MBM_07096 [Drepanopeziza brunnea f. sp. 'multigermtubi' MB_m1]
MSHSRSKTTSKNATLQLKKPPTRLTQVQTQFQSLKIACQTPLPPSPALPRPPRDRCLQCALAGFRCSPLPSPPRTHSHSHSRSHAGHTPTTAATPATDWTGCARCLHTSQDFCIRRTKLEEDASARISRMGKRAEEGEAGKGRERWAYRAEGLKGRAVDEAVLQARVDGLLEERRETDRWALPSQPVGARQGLRPLRQRLLEERARIWAWENLVLG